MIAGQRSVGGGTQVIIDTSVMVGLIDARDVHHGGATEIVDVLVASDCDLLLLDCVAVETIGVLCRRRAERKKPSAFPDLRQKLPQKELTRAYRLLEAQWDAVLEEVHASDGRLNAHDALILAYARRERIAFIASFDRDLGERGVGLLSTAEDARATLLHRSA